jgi:hypothetical protein
VVIEGGGGSDAELVDLLDEDDVVGVGVLLREDRGDLEHLDRALVTVLFGSGTGTSHQRAHDAVPFEL